MAEKSPQCVYCERSHHQVPLLEIKFKGGVSWICPQHLPILIHKPQNLIGKLPGAENLSPEGHDHH